MRIINQYDINVWRTHLPLSLNTRWDTANAAAYSAAMSLPGRLAVILYAGLDMVISSGLPQNPWSCPPFPTFYYRSTQKLRLRYNNITSCFTWYVTCCVWAFEQLPEHRVRYDLYGISASTPMATVYNRTCIPVVHSVHRRLCILAVPTPVGLYSLPWGIQIWRGPRLLK